MNNSIMKDIILNVILIIFPLLVYLVLVCYKENIKRSDNNFLLNISLFTSLYLCLRFGTTINNTQILLFCNIPIVIAYIKNKKWSAIILSLLNIIYCYFAFKTLCISTMLKYITYFILYIIRKKKKLSTNSFILSIAVLQGFFLSFEYFFKTINISINDFIFVLIVIFIYYFVTFSIVYIFKVIDKIESLNNAIKTLEKDKKIKDALFKLTHEIKNPLAVCKGYLEMIDIDKKEKTTKYISIMKQEINRSLNIMNDFASFNKIKIVKEQIDLNILLEDIYDSFKIIMIKHNTKLIYKREADEIYFMSDYERLKQVIVNLLKNSLESIEKNGKIKLYSSKYDNYLDIIIEDNGIGMDEMSLKRLKEMFYTTKTNGTGLGVALSDEIVKAHGGNLIYESELNKGTKVTIRLPYK